eukprot:IDg2455t1
MKPAEEKRINENSMSTDSPAVVSEQTTALSGYRRRAEIEGHYQIRTVLKNCAHNVTRAPLCKTRKQFEGKVVEVANGPNNTTIALIDELAVPPANHVPPTESHTQKSKLASSSVLTR